jgi:hypothetical protein
MIKKAMLSVVLVGFVIVAILSSGCVSNSDYGPVVKLNVTGKFTQQNNMGNTEKMVCTTLGTYKVYGPNSGYGSTSVSDDTIAWNTIPLNQEINVRLYGNKLWWVDWNGNKCCNSCCACATPTPTPTPTPCHVSTCNCGCSP